MLILCQVPHSYNKVPKTYLSIVYINLLGKQVSLLTNSKAKSKVIIRFDQYLNRSLKVKTGWTI